MVRGLGNLISFSVKLKGLLRRYLEHPPDDLLNNDILSYKLCIHLDKGTADNGDGDDEVELEPDDIGQDYFDLKFSLVCLNPGLGFTFMKHQKPASLLLTSGTLTPFDSFRSEFFLNFPIDLINAHVIQRKQCKTLIVKKGDKGRTLNFSMVNSNDESRLDVGYSLIKIAQNVPNGMLVCFASRRVMNTFIKTWESNEHNIIPQLNEIKRLFIEPQKASELKSEIEEYSKEAKANGAILFCVCKGKVSEGIDFDDEKARAVVLIGIPNLPIEDFRVKAKKKFLDSHPEYFKEFNGTLWYKQEGARAFNQAIGRVIRHIHDYGLVFLLDERYENEKSRLSNWVKENVDSYNYFEDVIKETVDFFKAQVPNPSKDNNSNNNPRPRPIEMARPVILPSRRAINTEEMSSPVEPISSKNIELENPVMSTLRIPTQVSQIFMIRTSNFATPLKRKEEEMKTENKSGPIKSTWSQRNSFEEEKMNPPNKKIKKNLTIEYEKDKSTGTLQDRFFAPSQNFSSNKKAHFSQENKNSSKLSMATQSEMAATQSGQKSLKKFFM